MFVVEMLQEFKPLMEGPVTAIGVDVVEHGRRVGADGWMRAGVLDVWAIEQVEVV